MEKWGKHGEKWWKMDLNVAGIIWNLNVAGIIWNPMGFVQLWNGFIGIPSEKNMWISAANMCAVSPARKVVKSPGFFMAGMAVAHSKKMSSVIFRFSWESLDLLGKLRQENNFCPRNCWTVLREIRLQQMLREKGKVNSIIRNWTEKVAFTTKNGEFPLGGSSHLVSGLLITIFITCYNPFMNGITHWMETWQPRFLTCDYVVGWSSKQELHTPCPGIFSRKRSRRSSFQLRFTCNLGCAKIFRQCWDIPRNVGFDFTKIM